MDLDVERRAFGTVVGVTGATIAPGTCRERNQKINFGKKFDEIAGPNGARFHEVLMRVARIASAHEYVHHIVNMNLNFFERQIPLYSEGSRQIRVTAMVVFRPLQQQVGIGVAPCADDIVHPSAIFVPPIPVEGVMRDGGHRT